MIVELIELEKGSVIGLRMEMEKAPLILIKARLGFVMCGYLDIETAEKLGDAAAVVRGVSSFEEMLDSNIANLTTSAKNLGITEKMTVRQALDKMI
ncbi:Domain of unknown function DUF1805 [Methanosalsum zhilinae DSM 4017]|uniref:DUF1805 domain-containing protein n=1 Tax=Methanosalsum zhilinae (strain DSM 4017 / NBRC 107636 / OCM 62 / WeN5) TaxID=679901 RepID=F7XMU9_METZD|nr:DUF1805 domain-containing protein [Methanosalsum zhilinae]AEH59966.1 Domain of unknown function DUF1805 [Methanosalsum zhilinae DSM 4017]